MSLKKISLVALLIFITILSCTKLGRITTNPNTKFNQHSIESFDEKIDSVMLLSSGAAATSAAISLLPDDVGTPIAEQLSDFSKYFLLILTALFFEKYFVVVSGFIISYLIIPLICILLIMYLIFDNKKYKDIAIKAMLTGIIIFGIVPCTVHITDLITTTYETSIEDAKNNSLASESTSNDEGLLSKLANTATSKLEEAASYVSQLFEALAVMIVVTCLIPILFLALALWLLKIVITQPSFSPTIDDKALKSLISKTNE